MFAFRAKKGDESDGPPNHGNTKLEIVWTILPCILLAVVGVWAWVTLSQNEQLESDRIEIEVEAAQFAWIFRYPDAGIQTGDLRVPDGRQIVLKMRSQDVIHDLYVPEWRLKQDVVPGITTELIVDTQGRRHVPGHLRRAVRRGSRHHAHARDRDGAVRLRRLAPRREPTGQRRRPGRDDPVTPMSRTPARRNVRH